MNFKPNVYLEALRTIHPNAQYTEGKAGNIVAKDSNNDVIVLDETKINAEVDRIEAEWTAQAYARNRAAEYPSIAELTVALYDTDDKAAIETKRAAVKAKYPKPS